MVEMIVNKKDKYNSDINILGSIPDYGLIIVSIVKEFSQDDASIRDFVFRTSKTMPRFQAAIRNNFFQFKNEDHRFIFINMYNSDVQTEIHNYFNHENALLSQVLINEALIDDAVFEVYALNDHDKQMVLDKEGISIGSYPLFPEAKSAYIDNRAKDERFPLKDEQITYIQSLPKLEQLAIRLEQAILQRGFSATQFGQMVEILGGDINSYLQNRFFAQLSDHLNLFMYLPKTPFIWHISSGKYHALECFVSIYKWSRDTLFRLKSVYVVNRETALRDRLMNLSINEDGASKTECELIREQLNELDAFRLKMDELLAEGYEPKLDDGVDKNIAPLQKKGMLSYEVLNAGQLKKYLNADW